MAMDGTTPRGADDAQPGTQPDETARDPGLTTATQVPGGAAAPVPGVVIHIPAPPQGTQVSIPVEAGQRLMFEGVDLAGATIEEVQGGLLVTLADGGVIFLAGYVAAAQAANPPTIEIAGFGTVPAAQLLAAAQGAGTETEPAAGPEGDGAGARFASAEPGVLGEGLSRGGLLGNEDFSQGTPDPVFGEGSDGEGVAAAGDGGQGGGGGGGGDEGGEVVVTDPPQDPPQDPPVDPPGGDTGGGTTDEPTFEVTGAQLLTNSNASQPFEQVLLVTLTDGDGNVLGSEGLDLSAEGQQGFFLFDAPIVLDPSQSYAVGIKYVQGDGQLIVTDFGLLDGDGNPFLTLQGDTNLQLSGGAGGGVDGAVYVLTGDGDGFGVSDAILFDLVNADADAVSELILNTQDPNTDFTLDMGLLPLVDDPATSDPDFPQNEALFGMLEEIDLSGSNNENNTLVLRPDDVMSLNDSGVLTLLSGNGNAANQDTVRLVDPDGGDGVAWTLDGSTDVTTADGDTVAVETWSYGSVSVHIQTTIDVDANIADPLVA